MRTNSPRKSTRTSSRRTDGDSDIGWEVVENRYNYYAGSTYVCTSQEKKLSREWSSVVSNLCNLLLFRSKVTHISTLIHEHRISSIAPRNKNPCQISIYTAFRVTNFSSIPRSEVNKCNLTLIIGTSFRVIFYSSVELPKKRGNLKGKSILHI